MIRGSAGRGARMTDEEVLAALADVSGVVGWVSADLLQRHMRTSVYDRDPSVTLVGRRLSRLAREGRCEKSNEAGYGMYRALA